MDRYGEVNSLLKRERRPGAGVHVRCGREPDDGDDERRDRGGDVRDG